MKVRIVSFVVNALQVSRFRICWWPPITQRSCHYFLSKKNLFPLIVSPDLLVTISGRDFVSLALVTSRQFPSWFFQVNPFPSGFASSLRCVCQWKSRPYCGWTHGFVVVYFDHKLKPEIPFFEMSQLSESPPIRTLPECDQPAWV